MTHPTHDGADAPVDHHIHLLRFRAPFAFRELPRLAPSSTPPDVELEVGPVPAHRPVGVGDGGWYEATPSESLLYWPEFGALRVRDGRSLVVDPLPSVERDWLRAVVLGTGLTVVLQQRGLYALHASAVCGPRGAWAFVGESGAGKSSLCAALLGRGRGLLCDDVLGLRAREDAAPLAVPGRTEVKLAPEAALHLGHDPDALAPLAAAEGKGALQRTAAVDHDVPLEGVCVLEWGDDVRVEPLSAQEAFRVFLDNAHRPELVAAAITPAAVMRQCAALAQHTRVVRLVRPRDWASLERVLARLEELGA